MNFTNAYGQWQESKEEITLLPTGGAAATQGRHKVYFPADIYNGVLEVVTPDGRHLKSRPLGVTYDDGSNTVFIATLKHAQGYLTSSNQVTYRDAFEGIKADLVATYRRSGFECDLVFRQQPPTPEQYGLDSDSSTLQMITEFFNTADPEQIPATSDEWYGLQDSTLKFGKLTMKQGKAFAIKSTNAIPHNLEARAQNPVYKRWLKLENRKFLIEELPLAGLAEDLNALPLTASIQKPATSNLKFATNKRQFPPAHEFTTDTNQILLASAAIDREPGVVLDYTTVDSDQSSFTFQASETYLVIGPVILGNGAEDESSLIFQGGATIKFTANAGNGISFDYLDANYETDQDHPVILTSKDDNSVGEVISDSNGQPTILTNVTFLGGQVEGEVKNIYFNYAGTGVYAGDPIAFENCRFYNCQTAIKMSVIGPTLYNCLFSGCGTCVYFDNTWYEGSEFWLSCVDVTADSGTKFMDFADSVDFYYISVINSLFTRFTAGTLDMMQSCGTDGLYDNESSFEQSEATCFKSNASASYYLTSSSPYRDIGSTNFDFGWLGIDQMTTYAPQDGGYPDTNAPDLGYHYPVNEDSDHDGLPDWWEWHWFGNYTHIGSELDANGNTLLSDYQNYDNGTVTNDPNTIAFSIESMNDFVNHTNVSVQLDITGGVPSYYAIYVNQTTTTNWLPFTSTNLTINLGSTDGTYNVVVGLKGLAPDATETWRNYEFYLDRVKPVLTITNPILVGAAGTVIKPYLQLQGFANKPLVSLSYDISNAFGLATNLDAFVTDQAFDTNQFDFTTNYFQAYDVPLATNVNAITLRVTDRAGNTTTTNFSVVLDYTTATNPPVVKPIWPEDNMAIYGTSFTLRGTMSDETGTVRAQVVDGAGNTNIVEGIVERDGMFWVENLPLTTNGDNIVSVTATDAAGNMTTTNIMVFESEVALTIDSSPEGEDLYKTTGTVSGTVSEVSWVVYVNGMRVNVDTNENSQGTYNWSADNVPIYGKGTATFDAVALPSGAAPPPANANISKEMPAYWCVADYFITETDDGGQATGDNWHNSWMKSYTASAQPDANGQWQQTYTGWGSENILGIHYTWPYCSSANYSWSNDWAGVAEVIEDCSSGTMVTWDLPAYKSCITAVPDMDSYAAAHVAGWWGSAEGSLVHYYADQSYTPTVNAWGTTGPQRVRVTANTYVKLYTGGKAKINRQNLFCITADTADEYYEPAGPNYGWPNLASRGIAKTQLRVCGKQVGADGKLWVALPDNSEQDITVIAKGKKHYNASASPQKYKLAVQADVVLDPDVVNETNCVGQNINFSLYWEPGRPPIVSSNNPEWTLGGTYVNKRLDPIYTDASETYTNDPNLLKFESTHAWWYDGKYDPPEKLTADFKEDVTFDNGQTASLNTSGLFSMHRPEYEKYSQESIYNALTHHHALNESPGLDVLQVYEGRFSLRIDSRFHGDAIAYITQTWTGSKGNDTGVVNFDTQGNDYLDNNQVAGEANDPALENDVIGVYPDVTNILPFDDGPAITCSGFTWNYSGFKAYVRFEPVGGIPVTIGIVNWHCYGDADRVLIPPYDYWPPASAFTAQDKYGNYVVPTGDAKFDAFTSDNTFPKWIHTYTNGETN